MSKLGDHLVNVLTAGRADLGQPRTFRESAQALWRAAGSQRRAAELASVDRRTLQRWFQRWSEGREPRPRPGTAAKVGTGLRRAQLDPGRPATRDFKITVHDRKPHARDRATRERTLSGSQLRLRAGTMERLADVWTGSGDAEAVAAAFLAGVGDPFYRRWLAPAPADRDRPPEEPAEFDDEDQEPADEGPEDAYDEFYDDIYEGADDIPDEDYGADP